MPTIPLPCGRAAIVSPEDYAWAIGHAWQSTASGNAPDIRYAKRNSGNGVTIRMHREIMARMGVDVDAEVDHINGDGLDNRRENLRPATRAENLRNRRTWGAVRYRGVSKARGRYMTQIGDGNGHQVTLGRFDSPTLAAAAYNVASRILHGEFARLNDVPADLEAEAVASGGRNLRRIAEMQTT